MKVKRKLKTLTIAAAVGGALAYLFDPNRGTQRREQASGAIQKAARSVTHAREQAADAATAVGDAIPGVSEPSASDVTSPVIGDVKT